MSILPDEQIDVRMRAALPDLPVFTVQDKGWTGLKNGELREQLNQNHFRFFVTADKNLPFQQNLQAVHFTIVLIVLLDTPTLIWEHQRQFASKLAGLLTINTDPIPLLIHISIEGLSKGKKVAALRKLLPTDKILFV